MLNCIKIHLSNLHLLLKMKKNVRFHLNKLTSHVHPDQENVEKNFVSFSCKLFQDFSVHKTRNFESVRKNFISYNSYYVKFKLLC